MSRKEGERDDSTIYTVVINHEEQYSIWPEYKKIPGGWRSLGKTGLKGDCLGYIKEVWTDMRPLSLRKKMEEFSNNPPPSQPSLHADPGSDRSLVDRLCDGSQPVEVGLRPERNIQLFKDAIDNNYVYINFIQTKGGTELGFYVDRSASNLSEADFENGKGAVHLEGDLTLDYVRVRCIADVDLASLQGTGRLVRFQDKEELAS